MACTVPSRAGSALTLALALAGVLAARGEERPAYRDLRFEESWAALGAPDALASRDPFDPVKWVPLGDAFHLSLGGQARERFEAWDGFAFGNPSDDEETLWLTRLRLHADLHAGERVRAFVEAKAAFTNEPGAFDGARAADSDTFDLQNGFLEWAQPFASGAELTARIGRQELRLGKQRLVSPLDWANARRTFDGLTLDLAAGSNELFAFAVLPVRVRPYERNDHVTDSWFYGLHGRHELPGSGRAELYAYGLERDTASGDERRQTLGARVSSPLGASGFDVEGEAAWQLGHRGPDDISAGMVSGTLGYWRSDRQTSPRVFIGADWATGDAHAGGDIALFDQLFPLGHAYFGIADLVARQNVIALSAGLSLRPHPALQAELAVHHFRRAAKGSGWFNAGGAEIRPAAPGASQHVGEEIDLTAAYRVDVHTQLGAGYAHFFPGAYIEQTGPSESPDFFYLFAQYTF
jgi:hypothetical protein